MIVTGITVTNFTNFSFMSSLKILYCLRHRTRSFIQPRMAAKTCLKSRVILLLFAVMKTICKHPITFNLSTTDKQGQFACEQKLKLRYKPHFFCYVDHVVVMLTSFYRSP